MSDFEVELGIWEIRISMTFASLRAFMQRMDGFIVKGEARWVSVNPHKGFQIELVIL
jgi:hypothetical protein